ncbi:AIPR family protein [Succinivibrio sp.]|uniref:AIPR family protein n=1 Tax=Succinivibrio sp. TaxID=2053619 RepID=UPI0025EB3E2F|nr:AIPR family protein [Succinivibrio sp.]MBQ9221167.1 AIPR family protein [Succinivibrio sp.]
MSIYDSVDKFYVNLTEQINCSLENGSENWKPEDFLTYIMLDYLEDAGEVESPIMCPYKATGLQLNAYAYSEDEDSLKLFVTIFSDSTSPRTVTATDVDATLKRAVNLFHKAVNDLYESFKKDTDTYEFAKNLNEKKVFSKVNICILTNGRIKTEKYKTLLIDDNEISFSLWDIDRLFRCISSGKNREIIEIDFKDKFGFSIPCIENNTSDKYSVYLAIINGSLLSELYKEYRDRLLEKNVRSFLQTKGAVNKGLKQTLVNEPDMFLAFNNGISVTAEQVELERDSNGTPSIKKIKDLQIVNGGQTTASIFNSGEDKKNPADLSKVYVQMKLSVIKEQTDMDLIVPRISTYANTQNKIQLADFSANAPFHRKIEELSRTIWTPNNGNGQVRWFYERARGQYADRVSRETTPKRRKDFKATHILFTKTDLAKYENTWDQLPYFVSEGAQKNFNKFTLRLNERDNFIPNEKYFYCLIAKAILFRKTEKLVQMQQFGGYRANIVTYTLAFLSNKTAQKIDLEKIWKEQDLSSDLENVIISISHLVHNHIVNTPNGENISEWCKKKVCWENLCSIEYNIPSNLISEQLASTQNSYEIKEKNVGIDTLSQEDLDLIEKVNSISAKTWLALAKWAKETNNYESWQRRVLFSVGVAISRKKKPSIKQSKICFEIYSDAISKGFTPENKIT